MTLQNVYPNKLNWLWLQFKHRDFGCTFTFYNRPCCWKQVHTQKGVETGMMTSLVKCVRIKWCVKSSTEPISHQYVHVSYLTQVGVESWRSVSWQIVCVFFVSISVRGDGRIGKNEPTNIQDTHRLEIPHVVASWARGDHIFLAKLSIFIRQANCLSTLPAFFSPLSQMPRRTQCVYSLYLKKCNVCRKLRQCDQAALWFQMPIGPLWVSAGCFRAAAASGGSGGQIAGDIHSSPL